MASWPDRALVRRPGSREPGPRDSVPTDPIRAERRTAAPRGGALVQWIRVSLAGLILAGTAIGAATFELAPASPVGATCLAANTEAVAVGGHGGVDLWIAGERRPLGAEVRNVFALAFAGDVLIETGGSAARRAEVRAWRWRTGELLWETTSGSDLLYSAAVSGERVYAGGADSRIAVLDLATGELEGHFEGHTGAVLALAASPDGTTLVSAGVDRSLRVWDLPSGELVRAIHNHGDRVHALSWSADGRYLASASADRTVRIFQPRIGRLVRIVRGHQSAVLAVTYADEGIWSGTAAGVLRRIESTTDRILEERPAHDAWIVGLAQQGAALASVDDGGRAVLWTDPQPTELTSAD